MPLQKKDFIEIEFTARTKEGEIFDSNVKEDLQKLNPEAKAKPFVFCLGEGMFLKSIDDFLMPVFAARCIQIHPPDIGFRKYKL